MLRHYRIHDILSEIDRSKTTLLRWEALGLIPKAHRDSRGWRYYTEEEARQIIEFVKRLHYPNNIKSDTPSKLQVKHEIT